MMKLNKKHLRLIEFLIIGVLFGLIEDVIAVAAVSDAVIDAKTLGIILLVAIPFAILSELIVDHPRFWERLNIFRDERNQN